MNGRASGIIRFTIGKWYGFSPRIVYIKKEDQNIKRENKKDFELKNRNNPFIIKNIMIIIILD